jgi:ABC-type uncharacterized transport system permease subunit
MKKLTQIGNSFDSDGVKVANVEVIAVAKNYKGFLGLYKDGGTYLAWCTNHAPMIQDAAYCTHAISITSPNVANLLRYCGMSLNDFDNLDLRGMNIEEAEAMPLSKWQEQQG